MVTGETGATGAVVSALPGLIFTYVRASPSPHARRALSHAIEEREPRVALLGECYIDHSH